MGSGLGGSAPRWARRGQAVTELALVLPILLLLLMGVIEFGRAWMVSQVVTDAARQGARIASLLNETSAGPDSVRAVVDRALAAGSVDPDGIEFDLDGFQDGTGTEVSVTVGAPHSFWLLGPVFSIAGLTSDDDQIIIRSRAVMRNE